MPMDANQMVDLATLQKRLLDYQKQGLIKDVQKASNRARGELREWIERTHPQTAFNGTDLIIDNYNGQTHHQTVFGNFSTNKSDVRGTLFANYFQRWANTGVHGLPPHVRWWGYNQNAMQEQFARRLDEQINKIISI